MKEQKSRCNGFHFKAAGCGSLEFKCHAGAVLAAIKAVEAGLSFFLPVRRIHSEIVLYNELTPREFEILRLISDGEGNKSIADLLGISPHTVKFHIASIFEKLHVSSRTEAVHAAISRGLLSI